MSLSGQQMKKSEKINSLVEQLVAEVGHFSQQIKGVKDPEAALVDESQAAISKTAQMRGRALYFPYIGTGIGHGPYVELADGSVKLDLINGIGIHILGHSHPRVLQAAVRGSLSDVIMQGNLQPNGEYQRFTEMLVNVASKKSRLKHAWIATCGTMANENALKAARQKNTPARLIIAFKDAFAGRSTLMAEITDNPSFKEGLPAYNEVLRLPFYDKKDPQGSSRKTLETLKEHYARNEKNIAAFVFEPMLGEGGYKSATKEFFVPLLEFCREKKIAVWADEIQTFMRTGEMFAFESLGIGEYIDVCSLAKTAQVGATLFTEEYNAKPGLISGTFSGSAAALGAGLEIMNIIVNEGYLGPEGKIQKVHQAFVGMLNELNETTCKGLLTEAGGMGLMLAVTPYDGAKQKVEDLLKRFFKNGLIAFSCGKEPTRIRFLLPAILTEKDIGVAKKIIEKSILEGV